MEGALQRKFAALCINHLCILNQLTLPSFAYDVSHLYGELQVGEQDKIFGTVKTSEIVEYVQKQTGRTLDVGDIDMPDISRLGTYEGTVKLHPEVTGIFTVKVVKQPE